MSGRDAEPRRESVFSQHAPLIALFATLLSLSVGASIWIGKLQADVYSNARWIEARNADAMPSRLATIESEIKTLERRIHEVEEDMRTFRAEGHQRYEDYLRRTQPGGQQ